MILTLIEAVQKLFTAAIFAVTPQVKYPTHSFWRKAGFSHVKDAVKNGMKLKGQAIWLQ